MIRRIKDNSSEYDSVIYQSDWRYDATIVGLAKFFDWLSIRNHVDKSVYYHCEINTFSYDSKQLSADLYKEFLYDKYGSFCIYNYISQRFSLLEKESGETKDYQERVKKSTKEINDKLKLNSVKRYIGEMSTKTHSKDEILEKLKETRYNCFAEYAEYTVLKGMLNQTQYEYMLGVGSCFEDGHFELKNDICMVGNYTIDKRKKKQYSYNFSDKTFMSENELEFLFIPFAFIESIPKIFVRNNYTVKQLIDTANDLELYQKEVSKRKKTINSLEILKEEILSYKLNSVEVIYFDTDEEKLGNYYVDTTILEALKYVDESVFDLWFKDSGQWVYYSKLIEDAILRKETLDNWILTIMQKEHEKPQHNFYSYSLNNLVKVNVVIKESKGYFKEDIMTKSERQEYLSEATEMAVRASKKLYAMGKSNRTYTSQMESALRVGNAVDFKNVLMAISNVTQLKFGFMRPLLEDFETNKDIAYMFVFNFDKIKPVENKSEE